MTYLIEQHREAQVEADSQEQAETLAAEVHFDVSEIKVTEIK